MHEKIISLATPVFFLLIAIEWLAGRLRGRDTYRLNDAISSIGLGVLSQVAGVFTRVLRVGIYVWLYERFALAEWPAAGALSLLAAVVFYDFCYYWHHRFMHRVAAAWAAHVVHHSSEDYNLSTALRQTGSGALLGWIPYVPMALAGVPPTLFAIAALIDLLYQFWIHTAQIGRLGWFDRVFASPSNHRVHHAVNPRYLDRNYGGILIVWDRLFGSFEDERPDDPPVYGTRHPLRSFNPLWANLEVYCALLRDSRRLPRWRDRLQVWWRPPGWQPASQPGSPPLQRDLAQAPGTDTGQRFDPQVPARVLGYVVTQFAVTLGLTVHFLEFQRDAHWLALVVYAVWIGAALTGLGGLLEGRPAFTRLEIGRHLLVAAWLAGGMPAPPFAPGGSLALALLALAFAAHAGWLRSAMPPGRAPAAYPPRRQGSGLDRPGSKV